MKPFTTISGRPIEPLYRPEDAKGVDYARDLGDPGQLSRSPAASTRRCTAARPGPCASSRASARPRQTNERFKYLLAQGSHGLSVAFDLPTLMGRDPDHPAVARRGGEVRRRGHARSRDMETLFEGIPLDQVTTSMTINSPAAMLLAFYILVGEKQGVRPEQAGGHGPGRHPEGVHRPEGVHLPAAARACGSSWT